MIFSGVNKKKAYYLFVNAILLIGFTPSVYAFSENTPVVTIPTYKSNVVIPYASVDDLGSGKQRVQLVVRNLGLNARDVRLAVYLTKQGSSGQNSQPEHVFTNDKLLHLVSNQTISESMIVEVPDYLFGTYAMEIVVGDAYGGEIYDRKKITELRLLGVESAYRIKECSVGNKPIGKENQTFENGREISSITCTIGRTSSKTDNTRLDLVIEIFRGSLVGQNLFSTTSGMMFGGEKILTNGKTHIDILPAGEYIMSARIFKDGQHLTQLYVGRFVVLNSQVARADSGVIAPMFPIQGDKTTPDNSIAYIFGRPFFRIVVPLVLLAGAIFLLYWYLKKRNHNIY